MPVTVQPSLSAALQHRMNHLVARQGVVASNVANANTPGYIEKDVQFQPLFKQASAALQMTGTNGKHLTSAGSSSAGKVVEDRSNMKLNGNSVSIDTEMLKLNEVQMNYRLATQLYSKHAAMQRAVLGTR